MPSSKKSNNIPYSSYDLLGVEVDSLTMADAATMIAERSAMPGSVYVVKPYVEFFDRAANDKAVLEVLNRSWLSLPDSVSTQWATTYLYGGRHSWWRALGLAVAIVLNPNSLRQFVPERFAGASFSWQMLEAAERYNRSVYLIGSPVGGSIEHTAAVINHEHPRLKIVGTYPGELGKKSGEALERVLNSEPVESELVTDLKQTKPDLILIGMGFPLQEKLMEKLQPQLDHGVMVGEGGTFDYNSFGGSRRRAPQWMRKIGLEWLWRLILQPSRIGRQMAIPRFMWRIYRQSR
jgi:N-acetylglucosaminyldiphosphoundecaprenol N-acetyl-beta-D-mannosaminyltransferase